MGRRDSWDTIDSVDVLSLLHLCSFRSKRDSDSPFSLCTKSPSPEPSHLSHLHLASAMSHLSADTKHHILLEYKPGVRGCGFKALAARHSIKGGRKALSEWHARWDGTPRSLEERAKSGRPRVLSSAEVRRHVAAPIRNANRAARQVTYPQLLPQVQTATGTDVSLPTLKRYGKEELHATVKRGKKRTAYESKRMATTLPAAALLLRAAARSHLCMFGLSDLQCLPICVRRSPRSDAVPNESVRTRSSSWMKLTNVWVTPAQLPLCCQASRHSSAQTRLPSTQSAGT